MKTIINSTENISNEIIAQLIASELEKLRQDADGLAKKASIEYRMARYAALNVDFIGTTDELRLYTEAIYNAVMWGKH